MVGSVGTVWYVYLVIGHRKIEFEREEDLVLVRRKVGRKVGRWMDGWMDGCMIDCRTELATADYLPTHASPPNKYTH